MTQKERVIESISKHSNNMCMLTGCSYKVGLKEFINYHIIWKMKRNAAQIHLDNISGKSRMMTCDLHSDLEHAARFFLCLILYCSWRIQKNDISSSCVDAVNWSITLRDLDAPSFQLRSHYYITLFMNITQKMFHLFVLSN